MATSVSMSCPSSTPLINKPTNNYYIYFVPSFSSSRIQSQHHNRTPHSHHLKKFPTNSYRISTRGGLFTEEEDEEDEEENRCSFDEAVLLFNKREYYRCHDVLEAIWNKSQEPTRTLVHAILQTAVGFHHLFNQNHKGAMMELGEGLCKLRKLNFERGPFHEFERQISAVLEFIYQTQLEQAACTEEYCIAMDGSERSYQLLGGYAAGKHIYHLEIDNRWNAHIVFCPDKYQGTGIQPPSIQIPVLEASEQNMLELEYH